MKEPAGAGGGGHVSHAERGEGGGEGGEGGVGGGEGRASFVRGTLEQRGRRRRTSTVLCASLTPFSVLAPALARNGRVRENAPVMRVADV